MEPRPPDSSDKTPSSRKPSSPNPLAPHLNKVQSLTHTLGTRGCQSSGEAGQACGRREAAPATPRGRTHSLWTETPTAEETGHSGGHVPSPALPPGLAVPSANPPTPTPPHPCLRGHWEPMQGRKWPQSEGALCRGIPPCRPGAPTASTQGPQLPSYLDPGPSPAHGRGFPGVCAHRPAGRAGG